MSPIGSFDRAEPYFKYFEHVDIPQMDIKKVFVDDNDVCVLHELNFGTPPAPMLICTWCHVDKGKIDSIKVVFDPRPGSINMASLCVMLFPSS